MATFLHNTKIAKLLYCIAIDTGIKECYTHIGYFKEKEFENYEMY